MQLRMLQGASALDWLNWAMNGVALLLFLAGIALGLWQLRREKQGAQTAELEKIAQARAVLRNLLQGSVFGLVTRAEERYGAGTGEIKKSDVLARLLQLLPAEYRTVFSADELTAWIETGLAQAKEIWHRTATSDPSA